MSALFTHTNISTRSVTSHFSHTAALCFVNSSMYVAKVSVVQDVFVYYRCTTGIRRQSRSVQCQVYKVCMCVLQVYYRHKMAKQKCAVSDVQGVCVYYRHKKAKQKCTVSGVQGVYVCTTGIRRQSRSVQCQVYKVCVCTAGVLQA